MKRSRKRSLIVMLTIFSISEIFAILIFVNLYFYDYIIWTEENVSKTDYSNHVMIMGSSMIILNGHGMVIFRLFPTKRTIIMKYVHTFIHTAVIGGFGYGYYEIYEFMDENEHPLFSFDHLHTYLAVLTCLLYLIQWFVGGFVYLNKHMKQVSRKKCASMHNFMGICILQLSIATACVQLQEMNYEINETQYHAEVAMISMVVYGMLINSIVLNPYLEWRLVGPL